MVDLLAEDSTPVQPPALTPLEAARAEAAMDQRLVTQCLMTEEVPDFETVLGELVIRPAWHALAACKGVGPNVFHPQRGAHQTRVGGARLLRGCSVKAECLTSALDSGEHSAQGVWSGTSARQRQAMRRGVA